MSNVLHLVEHLFEGGIERLLEQLTKHHCDPKTRLAIFSYQTEKLGGIGEEIKQRGIPLYIYDKPIGYDFKLISKLIRVIRENNITTIHTHDFGPMEYAVALKIRFPRLKLVHTHHSVFHFIQYKRYKAFFQFASYFYDQIICVSPFVKKEVRRHCPLTKNNLTVIPNGIDLSNFDVPKAAFTKEKLKLINVSRISEEKNLIYLLETCKKLKENGVAFELHHAGSGERWLEDQLTSFVEHNQLEEEITFHGFQSDIRKVLSLGDIFVSASKTEGHPVAVLEAMASQKLCVCSDIEAHRQLRSNNILYFNLKEDALYDVLTNLDPNVIDTFPPRAKKDVSREFSIEKMVNQYTEVYGHA